MVPSYFIADLFAVGHVEIVQVLLTAAYLVTPLSRVILCVSSPDI